MSDLVGNPEDRFSRVAAQIRVYMYIKTACVVCRLKLKAVVVFPEYNSKIIGAATRENRSSGFRPGPTQTGLYSHRSRLEA